MGCWVGIGLPASENPAVHAQFGLREDLSIPLRLNSGRLPYGVSNRAILRGGGMLARLAPIFAVLCIVLGFTLGIPILKLMEDRPEMELIPRILASNTALLEHFGSPVTVDYRRQGSRVSVYHGDLQGLVRGKYIFDVTGSRIEGSVSVSWESNSSETAKIMSIFLLEKHRQKEIFRSN